MKRNKNHQLIIFLRYTVLNKGAAMINDGKVKDKNKNYEGLLEKLKFDEERLTALLKMTQLKGLSEKDYIDYTLEECVRLTRSKVGYLHFVNEDQNTLSLFTWSKDVLRNCTAEKVPHYPITEAGIWADCFREKKPVIHNDYSNNPHKKGYPEGHFPVYRHMSVPIFDDDNKVVSIVGVGNKDDPYDDSDTRQLTLFMDKMWRIIKQNRADQLLKESEIKYREAYNRAEFYRRIFAHDMRNILQAIQGSVGILPYIFKNIEDAEKFNEMVKKIQTHVFRGAELIKNVCTLSDLECSEELEKIEVISILHSAIEFVSEKSTDKKVNIKFENKLENFFIAANDLLLDIFENILINAIDHNENDQIEIQVRVSKLKDKEGSLIKIEFIDNGIGIPNNMKENILQGDYEKRSGSKGMGIGLTLIHTLTKSFNGSLYIADRIKGDHTKGTNFILVFPEFT